MPIYTLVAILLAITGSTYTALNSLRAIYEEWLKIAKQKTRNKHPENIIINSETKPKIEATTRKILWWYSAWQYSHFIMALLLNVCVYIIVVWSLYHWDGLTTSPQGVQGPFEAGKYMILTVGGTGFICTLLGLTSVVMINDYTSRLDDLIGACKREEIQSRNPVDPSQLKPPTG